MFILRPALPRRRAYSVIVIVIVIVIASFSRFARALCAYPDAPFASAPSMGRTQSPRVKLLNCQIVNK